MLRPHPHAYQKTKKGSPTWHMVDVEFESRAKHFVSLSVLKGIPTGDTPEYLSAGDVDAIKGPLQIVYTMCKAFGGLLFMRVQGWRYLIVEG